MADFQRTFGIIKPDAVSKKVAGQIIARIEESGLSVVAMKRMQLDTETAQGFYAVHKERPFFGELVSFMTAVRWWLSSWRAMMRSSAGVI